MKKTNKKHSKSILGDIPKNLIWIGILISIASVFVLIAAYRILFE